MKANEKDQIEVLMRQADFHIERFDKRREYSWKIALAFWGAILGAVTLLKDTHPEQIHVYIGGGLVIFLHWVWLTGVFKADQKDKLVAFKCRDICIMIINKSIRSLGEKVDTPCLTTHRKFWGDWSAMFQLGTTILLVAAMGLLVLS